jgi:hypothetical protein
MQRLILRQDKPLKRKLSIEVLEIRKRRGGEGRGEKGRKISHDMRQRREHGHASVTVGKPIQRRTHSTEMYTVL